MNDTKASMPLLEAREIAVSICKELLPYCEPGRIRIAGSIRRKKHFVGDLEIVAQPRMVSIESPELFGVVKTQSWVNDGFRAIVRSLGEVIKGEPTGRYMQIMLPQGVKLDLFMPQPHDFFRQLAIRTGDANYSHLIIAYGWTQLGWCGTEEGLRRVTQCKEKGGKNICVVKNPDLPPAWESEEDFFRWLKVPYREPEKRKM